MGLEEATLAITDGTGGTFTMIVRTKCDGRAIEGMATGDFIAFDSNGASVTATITDNGDGNYSVDIGASGTGTIQIDEVFDSGNGVFQQLTSIQLNV